LCTRTSAGARLSRAAPALWRRPRTDGSSNSSRPCQIVSSYWCSHAESAVALTEKRQTRLLRLLSGPQLAFHRVSDWATQGQPDVARQLHACDELAVRATHVLTGLRRRVCMQLVAAGASHLLSLVDARAAHEDSEKAQAALAQERTGLEGVAVSSDFLKLRGVTAGGAEPGPVVVAALFAGFSERWAQDTLAAALPAEAPKPKESPKGTGAGAP
jgi:hypothetical protein